MDNYIPSMRGATRHVDAAILMNLAHATWHWRLALGLGKWEIHAGHQGHHGLTVRLDEAHIYIIYVLRAGTHPFTS